MSEDSKDPISDSISETFGFGAILREARRQDKEQREKGQWMLCPSCGKRLIKKQLLKKGCYACGWKQGENKKEALPYRMQCPGCGREVVAKELIEKGCFICGWKPEAGGENNA